MSGHDKQTDGSIEVREEQGTEKDRNREGPKKQERLGWRAL